MRQLCALALAGGLVTPAWAEWVVYDVVTTFEAAPLTCQSISFGPDVGGVHAARDPSTVPPYTAILLRVRVTKSWAHDFKGAPVVEVPPHLRIPAGHAMVLLEGKAAAVCPKLQQPLLRMRLKQDDCDTFPREGHCLVSGVIRKVELAPESSSR